MITNISLSRLRKLQLLLGIAAAGSVLLPWLSSTTHLLGDNVMKSSMSGWSLNIASLLLVFVAGSLLVSLLEFMASRRAHFFHHSFFMATMLVGILVHMVQFIPGMNGLEIAWGFELYLLIAFALFALSALLAPPDPAVQIQERSEQGAASNGDKPLN